MGVGNLLFLISTALIVFTFHPASLQSQSRSAGQACVPIGWENKDSIRFGLFEGFDNLRNTSGDSLGANFDYEWGIVPMSASPLGKQKGFVSYAAQNCDPGDINRIGNFIKQRTYYPSPLSAIHFRFDNGYWWRYNDINMPNTHAKWFNNPYDSNDVSPYAEYPSNRNFVKDSFLTRRFNIGSDTTSKRALFGNEGRVILDIGITDSRNSY